MPSAEFRCASNWQILAFHKIKYYIYLCIQKLDRNTVQSLNKEYNTIKIYH